jgi:hypothetical protein
MCSYVRKFLCVKGTGPRVLGKVVVNIVKREEYTQGHLAVEQHFIVWQRVIKMSDLNVKGSLVKMSKINVAHHEVSKLEGEFGDDLITTEIDTTFYVNVNDIGGHPFYTCEVCERKL